MFKLPEKGVHEIIPGKKQLRLISLNETTY